MSSDPFPIVIEVLTSITLLGGIWFKGIRPMMKAIGELLDTDDKLDQHLTESHLRWDDFQRRLERIERKVDNGH